MTTRARLIQTLERAGEKPERYKLVRYRISLSSWVGIAFNASHWYCRVRWLDAAGRDYLEADAERGRGDDKTMRFDDEASARASGLRLAHRLAEKHEHSWYVVTEGSHCTIDPQKTLSAPGNLKQRLNTLWRAYEKMDGWSAPKSQWPALQKICDRWCVLIGEPQWVDKKNGK